MKKQLHHLLILNTAGAVSGYLSQGILSFDPLNNNRFFLHKALARQHITMNALTRLPGARSNKSCPVCIK